MVSWILLLCGVQGPKSSRPGINKSNPRPRRVSKPRGHLPEESKRIRTINILWRLEGRRKDNNGGRDGGRKFPEWRTSHLRIQCLTTTLSTSLMWKWPMNSDFKASSPFYHLQQSLDGTLSCEVPWAIHMEGWDARKRDIKGRESPQKKEVNILRTIRIGNRTVNNFV